MSVQLEDPSASAEVLNVTMGKKGGLNIDYTYQKDPYQVFEPGGRLHTRSRDPQRLMGGSIREIAQELVGKRYIRTRRVEWQIEITQHEEVQSSMP